MDGLWDFFVFKNTEREREGKREGEREREKRVDALKPLCCHTKRSNFRVSKQFEAHTQTHKCMVFVIRFIEGRIQPYYDGTELYQKSLSIFGFRMCVQIPRAIAQKSHIIRSTEKTDSNHRINKRSRVA